MEGERKIVKGMEEREGEGRGEREITKGWEKWKGYWMKGRGDYGRGKKEITEGLGEREWGGYDREKRAWEGKERQRTE